MRNILIAGAGGCGREVWEMALTIFPEDEYHLKGFLSDDLTVLDSFPEISARTPVIGTIIDYEVQEDDYFLLAIGSPGGRRLVAERLKAKGAKFLTMVHPTAQISPLAKIGQGTIIYPFCLVTNMVQLGEFCLLNAYAGCGHDAEVGAYSVLCPHATVLGYTSMGEECFLGTSAMAGPKKKFGNRVTISANSAALRSAPDDAFICGVPGNCF